MLVTGKRVFTDPILDELFQVLDDRFGGCMVASWADVWTRARRKGRPIEVADGWIAATALALDVPLLTHNPTDFAGVDGLTVLSAAADGT